MPQPIETPLVMVKIEKQPLDKTQAINEICTLLEEAGSVEKNYAKSMFKREEIANTYLGSGIAIPHGVIEDKSQVKIDALSIILAPEGVDWGDDQIATIIVGIAAATDSHIDILKKLASLINDKERLDTLLNSEDPEEIKKIILNEPFDSNKKQIISDFPDKMNWVVAYPSGLHARPAGVWVESAKKLGLPIRIRFKNNSADSRNFLELLSLGLKKGDRVTISTQGENARQALIEFKKVIESLVEEEEKQFQAPLPTVSNKPLWWDGPLEKQNILTAVPASSGLVIGKIFKLENSFDFEVVDRKEDFTQASNRLQSALSQAKVDLLKISKKDTASAIFKAQSIILDDVDLLTKTCRLIVSGHGVAWSWKQVIEEKAKKLGRVSNPVLAARASDIKDVGRRVLFILDPSLKNKLVAPDWSKIKEPVILVAEDLTPSETANLDTQKIAAIATIAGGPTSHTAILAKTLGLPALVATGPRILLAQNDHKAIVDADNGFIWLEPSQDVLQAAEKFIEQKKRKAEKQREFRLNVAKTLDNMSCKVLANINTPDQVAQALNMGAEGVGLMRTEFLFLGKDHAPSVEEQYQTYLEMSKNLHGRELIIRALDIGGDKNIPYLNLPKENNPFLGVRGSRLLLNDNKLLTEQLKAIYLAAKDGAKLSLMFPMISMVDELKTLRKECTKIQKELKAPEIPLGIMVEVPAAAILSDVIAKYADFFSIGTNDLTQYVMAMDRQNPLLAKHSDSLHPAVLRMIEKTVQGAKVFKRNVGVCGGLAGDPFGAIVLLGLGVKELSMSFGEIPAVKDAIRKFSLANLQVIAQRALNFETADEVRALKPKVI